MAEKKVVHALVYWKEARQESIVEFSRLPKSLRTVNAEGKLKWKSSQKDPGTYYDVKIVKISREYLLSCAIDEPLCQVGDSRNLMIGNSTYLRTYRVCVSLQLMCLKKNSHFVNMRSSFDDLTPQFCYDFPASFSLCVLGD